MGLEPWSKANARDLAQYVDPERIKLRLEINRQDLMSQPGGARRIVKAIYGALLQAHIRYAPEKYFPNNVQQQIRSPEEMLDKPGEGTCLDLALLFCAACLANDLLPMLIVIEGHALAAVSLIHSRRDWDAYERHECLKFDRGELTEVKENELINLIDSKNYIAIECTGFAHSKSMPSGLPEGYGRQGGVLSFEQAERVGRAQLGNRDRPFQYALDIATLHELGVRPFSPPTLTESSLLQQVKDGATLARVLDTPFDILIFGANFTALKPEEVALTILGNQSFTFRVDFSESGVTLIMEGYDNFYTPVPPSMIEVSKETSHWTHIIELEWLRQEAPLHPLARLSPKNLENVPIQLLVEDQALHRLSMLKKQTLFTLAIAGEVSGYLIGFFSKELSVAGDELKNLRFPRSIPGKPGFSPLVLFDWNTQLEFDGASRVGSLRDVSRSVDYLERQNHIESWRGIWPDLRIHQYFHRTHKVPLDENTLTFHPWNQHFVRLRKDFEDSSKCSVPGIAAFQLPLANAFYLFATIFLQDDNTDAVSFSKDGKDLHLSRREIGTILNVLRQLAILNYTWVKDEGNHIHGLCVLLPPRHKYVMLSSRLYYEYNLRHPYKESSDFVKLSEAVFSASITMIKDLP